MTTSQTQTNSISLGSSPGHGSILSGNRGGSPHTAGTTPDDVPREIGGGTPPMPHQANNDNHNPRDHTHTKKNKKSRANILVATLNMRGRASPDLGNSTISKWSTVQNVMREKKIGILCVQETHLTQEHEMQIESLYSRRLKVINSRDPFRPGNSAGVAFILNKEIINTTETEITEIIPGRALVMSIKWHNNERITILNTYAPNNPTKHPEFWNLISTTWLAKDLPRLDFMIGDFNLTEDALDRAPAQLDNENASNALRDIKHRLDIQDTWRSMNPTSRLFTFYSNTNSYSRLDRIYTSPRHERNVHNWESCTTAIPSDHKMVLVRFIPKNAPFIGKGRWAWPLSLMNDKKLFDDISNQGIVLQQRITHQYENRIGEANPQKSWEEFKVNITQLAKRTAKEHLHKIKVRTKQLEDDIKRTLEHRDIDLNENTRRHTAWIENELNHLEKKKFKDSQLHSQANWALRGETISKYWSRMNSTKKPRDIIHCLRRPNSNGFASRSDEMADIARQHHESLQQDNLPQEIEDIRRTTRLNFMRDIPHNQKLQNQDSPLHNLI